MSEFGPLARIMVAVLGLSVTAAGCSNTAAPPSQSTQVTLELGWVPAMSFTAFGATAQALQMEDDSDLRIELIPFRSSSDVLLALINGDIDMGTIGFAAVASALTKGDVPAKYVAGVSFGYSDLLARTGVSISSWEDVKGLNVGVTQGSSEYVKLTVAMASHGLSLVEDTQYTNVATAANLSLGLQSGDLDVVVSYAPFSSQAIVDGYAVALPALQKDLDEGFVSSTGILVTDAAIAQKSSAIQTFVDMYVDKVDEFLEDVSAISAAWQGFQDTDPAVVAEAFERVKPSYTMDESLARKVPPTLVEFEVISSDTSTELGEMFVYSFLEEATGLTAAELGAASD